jgi:CxxC motif-containing protein (DUF1111 family)
MRKPILLGVLISLVPIGVIADFYFSWRSAREAWNARTLHMTLEQNRALPPESPPRDLNTPLDPKMVAAGEQLFVHEWTPHDPLAGGDGLGPLYNATSCVVCHFQNGIGGSGGLAENVTTFAIVARVTDSKNFVPSAVVHNHSIPGRKDGLRDICTSLLDVKAANVQFPAAIQSTAATDANQEVLVKIISQRNSTALFGARFIDAIPESAIFANVRPSDVGQRLATNSGRPPIAGRRKVGFDGKGGRFGWKAQIPNLAEFVREACANEIGLGNPQHPDSMVLFEIMLQGRTDDLTNYQCDLITEFIASLPRPQERLPADSKVAADAIAGKRLFRTTGCADCHISDLGPVQGLYSDLLLHDMGKALEDCEGAGNRYAQGFLLTLSSPPPLAREWRTPPLWGVADSAPYLHDGRAATLEEAIRLHDGEGIQARERFERSNVDEKRQLLAFLGTLRAPVSAKKLPAAERARDESAAEFEVAQQSATRLLLGGGFTLVLAGLAIRSRWRKPAGDSWPR